MADRQCGRDRSPRGLRHREGPDHADRGHRDPEETGKEETPLFDKSIETPVPGLDAWIADVSVKGSLKLLGYASFGPGTLHDLRVAGLFSTHPGIVNTFELAGTIGVPAVAGIKAVATAKIVGQVWFGKKWEVASAGLTVTGDLALQLCAEAAAAAGRRKSDDGQPEYFIKGSLHGGAGLKLDLAIDLHASLAIFSRNIARFNRTYDIAGGSVTIDFDYVLGDKKKKDENMLKLNVELGGFDQDKFAQAVIRSETIKDKKDEGQQQAPGELDTVPNPDAPTPEEPPDPDAPIPPGPPDSQIKTLVETFTMEGAKHTLKLTLVDPPSLAMESVLEPLLNKIDRARKALLKDKAVGDAEKKTRLTALNKIRGVSARCAGRGEARVEESFVRHAGHSWVR